MFGAVIAAAGYGNRMGEDSPKQFLPLKGKPVLVHTLEIFLNMGSFFKQIVVVVPPGYVEYCREELFNKNYRDISENLLFKEGGAERQDSVYKGLLAMENDVEIICIHDGARPLVTADHLRALALQAQDKGAVIPAVPVTETLKEISPEGAILQTVPRGNYRLAQTPQCFRKEVIMEAYQKAQKDNYCATDDASIVEYFGYPVTVIPGENENIKITTPGDLISAEAILERRMKNV